jgi:hypothetical protein
MPDQDGLLQSLLSAADAAQQAYNAAQTANPGADLSQLYLGEIKAQGLYFEALNKTFSGDAAATNAQQELDAITQSIKDDLTTITNVNAWITAVGQLLQAATAVVGFFA